MEVSWMLVIVLCSFKFGVYAIDENDDLYNEIKSDEVCKRIKVKGNAISDDEEESVVCNSVSPVDKGVNENENAKMVYTVPDESSETTTLVDMTELTEETVPSYSLADSTESTKLPTDPNFRENSADIAQSISCGTNSSGLSPYRSQHRNNDTTQKYMSVTSEYGDEENTVNKSETAHADEIATPYTTGSNDFENITTSSDYSADLKATEEPSEAKEAPQENHCCACSNFRNRGSKSRTTTAKPSNWCFAENEESHSADFIEDDAEESDSYDKESYDSDYHTDNFIHPKYTDGNTDDLSVPEYMDGDTDDLSDPEYTDAGLHESFASDDDILDLLRIEDYSDSTNCRCGQENSPQSSDIKDDSYDTVVDCEERSNEYPDDEEHKEENLRHQKCSDATDKWPKSNKYSDNQVEPTYASSCGKSTNAKHIQYPDVKVELTHASSRRENSNAKLSKYSDDGDETYNRRCPPKKSNKYSLTENDSSHESFSKKFGKKSSPYTEDDTSSRMCSKRKRSKSKRFPSDTKDNSGASSRMCLKIKPNKFDNEESSSDTDQRPKSSRLDNYFKPENNPDENQKSVDVIPKSVKRITVDLRNLRRSRRRTKVYKPIGNLSSYAGFFKTNEEDDVHLFFWFFRSEKNWKKAPVVVWLQGEPGWSSLYSLFEEHGPYYIKNTSKGLTIQLREFAWTKAYNVLYLDHCVGCGFSLARSDDAYVPSYENVGRNVYEALYQFFTMMPEYKKNQLYLAGSYGGAKYIPVIADIIHSKNRFSKVQMNLKGMFIGGPYVDAAAMAKYSGFLSKVDLIDNKTRARLDRQEAFGKELIYAGKYRNAINFLEKRVYKTLKDMGYEKLYDVRYKKPQNDTYMFEKYVPEIVKSKQFRQMICLSQVAFQHQSKVLIEEIMHPVDDLLPDLLSNYKILYYLGRWDLMAPFTESFQYIDTFKWEGIDTFFQRNTQKWCATSNTWGNQWPKNCVDGCYKNYQNLTTVLLYNAGHTCGSTNSEHLFYLLQAFTGGKFEQKRTNTVVTTF